MTMRKDIHRAIETDLAECDFDLVRSEIYQAQGRPGMAAGDVRKAAGPGYEKECHFADTHYGDPGSPFPVLSRHRWAKLSFFC